MSSNTVTSHEANIPDQDCEFEAGYAQCMTDVVHHLSRMEEALQFSKSVIEQLPGLRNPSKQQRVITHGRKSFAANNVNGDLQVGDKLVSSDTDNVPASITFRYDAPNEMTGKQGDYLHGKDKVNPRVSNHSIGVGAQKLAKRPTDDESIYDSDANYQHDDMDCEKGSVTTAKRVCPMMDPPFFGFQNTRDSTDPLNLTRTPQSINQNPKRMSISRNDEGPLTSTGKRLRFQDNSVLEINTPQGKHSNNSERIPFITKSPEDDPSDSELHPLTGIVLQRPAEETEDRSNFAPRDSESTQTKINCVVDDDNALECFTDSLNESENAQLVDAEMGVNDEEGKESNAVNATQDFNRSNGTETTGCDSSIESYVTEDASQTNQIVREMLEPSSQCGNFRSPMPMKAADDLSCKNTPEPSLARVVRVQTPFPFKQIGSNSSSTDSIGNESTGISTSGAIKKGRAKGHFCPYSRAKSVI